MADNITANNAAATPETLAFDEVTINSTAVKVQRVKPGWGADGTWNETSATTAFPVAESGPSSASATTATGTVAFANSDAANTERDITLTFSATRPKGAEWLVEVVNLSTQTAYTVKPKNSKTINSVARTPELKGQRFTVSAAGAAAAAEGFIVQGLFAGTDTAILTFSNDTALNASGGNTVAVVVTPL